MLFVFAEIRKRVESIVDHKLSHVRFCRPSKFLGQVLKFYLKKWPNQMTLIESVLSETIASVIIILLRGVRRLLMVLMVALIVLKSLVFNSLIEIILL